jgi:hypothetical protein
MILTSYITLIDGNLRRSQYAFAIACIFTLGRQYLNPFSLEIDGHFAATCDLVLNINLLICVMLQLHELYDDVSGIITMLLLFEIITSGLWAIFTFIRLGKKFNQPVRRAGSNSRTSKLCRAGLSCRELILRSIQMVSDSTRGRRCSPSSG